MITAFNELLSCFVTGLFTALILWFMARIGMLPVMFIITKEEEEVEE